MITPTGSTSRAGGVSYASPSQDLAQNIKDENWPAAIDMLHANPGAVESLERQMPVFELLLRGLMLNAYDARGNQVFFKLLESRLMGNVSELGIDLLALDVSSKAAGLYFDRLTHFLQTDHARRVSYVRLDDLYRSFQGDGRDTARIEELLGPQGIERAQRMHGGQQGGLWSWCSLV